MICYLTLIHFFKKNNTEITFYGNCQSLYNFYRQIAWKDSCSEAGFGQTFGGSTLLRVQSTSAECLVALAIIHMRSPTSLSEALLVINENRMPELCERY
jgi:hypothetical protein